MSAPLRVYLVDDEPLAVERLEWLLRESPGIEVAGSTTDPEMAIHFLNGRPVDALFLDIQMPGINGFELLARLKEQPSVIFTTAYDQYAIRAFEVNALDYLLKPIAPERLAAALARVHPRAETARLEQVFVRDGERCWIVRLPDIFLLESEGNYARLYFGSERPLIRRSLNALEAQLDPAMFFRADRKRIVNLKWIEKVDVGISGGLLVTLRGGRTVEMSRRQSARLREAMSL